jgi:hypothetical protein
VELKDFSDLRTDEEVVIPLNGIKYRALANPPAQLIVEATTAASSAELALVVRAMQEDASLSAEERAQVQSVSRESTAKALKFLDRVLEPESAARWAHYMRPLPTVEEGADRDPTQAEVEDHQEHAITLRQCVAVYQQLVVHYAGRPTEAPSPSKSGRGASGGRSTAGRRAKA